MASEYRIHKPYALATLPRPLTAPGQPGAGIVAREVYGQRDGVRKKRTELAVGIDGETASIYDVPGSRLVTSYPVPPQERFTCPPHSLRIRRSDTADVLRYTFVATKDAVANKLTLFKDTVHRDGKTVSTAESRTLRSSPVRYITTSGASQTSATGDVIAVCQNGEVFCLSAEKMEIRWTSPARTAVQDASWSALDDFEVDFVTSGTVAELNDGLFKKRQEVHTALPKGAGTNTMLLVIVSRSSSQGKESRHLLVLAVAPGDSPATSEIQHLTPLDVAPIPAIIDEDKSDEKPEYHFEAQSGTLLQLQQGALHVYDLTNALPKHRSIIPMEGAVTFAPLTRPFVLSCSRESIGLYSYQYRSVHAKAQLDLSDLVQENQGSQSIRFISYLRSQELVVALVDNVLACIHVEPPQNKGKRRKAGLLIDSIGRGTSVEVPAKRRKSDHSSVPFSEKVPGTMTESYLAQHHEEIEAADELLGNDDVLQWEETMRAKFRVGLSADTQTADGEEVPGWEWLPEVSEYPPVDRRWVIYAISRVFTVGITEGEEQEDAPKLRLALPGSNVTTYLTHAGHLTLSNIRSAFRDDLEANPPSDKKLASDLVLCLIEADPFMSSLCDYLRTTKLGAVEVLQGLRALMVSMGLIPATGKLGTQNLLTLEPHVDNPGDDADDDIMDLDNLERVIAASEDYLGSESSVRSRALTMAFMKLWRLPSQGTVKALRTTLQTEEILQLIQMLRVELTRGAWTSLYLAEHYDNLEQAPGAYTDALTHSDETDESPPDGAITIIADLLGRCIDAVGAGGWLLNDAASAPSPTDAHSFFQGLSLEVEAAAQGLEEAVLLNSYVGETVRYGVAAQKAGAARQARSAAGKGILTGLDDREASLLPVGLKVKELLGREKVVGGGEVIPETMRETGRKIGQRVEQYSLERLLV